MKTLLQQPAFNAGDVFERVVSQKAEAVEPIGGGVNAHTFRVEAADGKEYLLKHYPGDSGAERLRVEFGAFTFLHAAGERAVPRPFFSDAGQRVAVYSYIAGRRFKSNELRSADVREATAFYTRVAALTKRPEAAAFGDAHGAAFSIDAYLAQLQNRFQALTTVKNPELESFVQKKLEPAWQALKRFCLREMRRDVSIGRALTRAQQILSASDVGFHNILHSADRKLYFIDFEYFGWDDPVKLVCDFLIQPDVPVPHALREEAVTQFFAGLGGNAAMAKRFAIVYPLIQMRWCFILLNVFLPGRAEALRRSKTLAHTQLEKAHAQLETCEREVESGNYLKWVERWK